MTHRLRTLTERDLVEISPDVDDGRGKNARLTGSGRRFLESVAPAHVEDVQRQLFDHLTPAETATMASAFSKVAANLCDHDNFLPNQL